METCYRDRQRETLRRTDEQNWTTLCMGDYDVRGLQEKTLSLGLRGDTYLAVEHMTCYHAPDPVAILGRPAGGES